MSDRQALTTGNQVMKRIASWALLIATGTYVLQAPLAHAQGS